MRLFHCLGVLVFSILWLAPAAFADQLFEYRVAKLGVASEQAACEADIRIIAQKFQEHSGITPFAAGCSRDEYDRGFLNGAVSYFAEQPVSVLSSRDRLSALDLDGGFSSMAACRAALPALKRQFESIYAAEAMTAICHQRYLTAALFAPLIEAIGESEMLPIFSGFTYYGRPIGPASVVTSGLIASAELRFPGRVMSASYESNRVTLRYYNTERVRLFNLSEMKFKTADACMAALGDVESIFANFADKPAVVFCTEDGPSGTKANIVTFTMEIGAPDTYSWYRHPATYASRAACEDAATGLVSARVAGGVCTDTVPSVLHLFLYPGN